jgi:hypothetical protein
MGCLWYPQLLLSFLQLQPGGVAACLGRSQTFVGFQQQPLDSIHLPLLARGCVLRCTLQLLLEVPPLPAIVQD